ncbi:dihydroorotate dehydrogenase electron transfer subunit [Lentibacillus sp. N15]|uniref:dihydroorotate dehydrogenase electron transfer subunit n=1 Tax=Lentibacillus songyuanensis TaxID=3136161 RepID=UPI0031BBC003
MMKQVNLIIESITTIALDTIEITFKNAYVAQTAKPGQFLHLQIDGYTLRRPISIAEIDREHDLITVLCKKFGEGTKKLGTYQTGMMMNAIGPNGNGFSFEDLSLKTALLVGGGIGVPPLYHLAKELKKNGIHVITVLGFQTKEHIFYEKKFAALGETYVVTDDGSYGKKGFVTTVLDQVGEFDHYFSCGPIPMLQAIREKLTHKPGSISLEERMGCGIGACFACVIPTDDAGGYKKICQDGPVFAAGEVIL